MYKTRRYFLDNGLKLEFVESENSNEACVHLRGVAGSNCEDTTNIGAAHLLEHVLYDSDEIDSLRNTGAKVIAVTSRDDVLYGYKTLKDDIPLVIQSIVSILSRRQQIPSNLDEYKEKVYSEIFRHINNPEKLITRLAYRTVFDKGRIIEFNTGTCDDVLKLNKDILQAFYENYYRTDNFCVVVTGNFQKKQKLEVIQQLEGITRLKKLHTEPNYLKPTKTNKTITHYFTGLQGSLIKIDIFGYRVDETKKYRLAILNEILLHKLSNNSFKAPPCKIHCASYNSRTYGLLDIFGYFPTKNINENIDEMLKIIQDVECDERCFNDAKKRLINKFLLGVERISNLTEYSSDLLLNGANDMDFIYELNMIRALSLDELQDEITRIKNAALKTTILI